MKKFVQIMALFTCALYANKLISQVGCMDKSKHACKCNEGCEICCSPDYKELYYVECACPCWRYQRISKHCRCINCGHYVKPEEFPVTYKRTQCD